MCLYTCMCVVYMYMMCMCTSAIYCIMHLMSVIIYCYSILYTLPLMHIYMPYITSVSTSTHYTPHSIHYPRSSWAVPTTCWRPRSTTTSAPIRPSSSAARRDCTGNLHCNLTSLSSLGECYRLIVIRVVW